MKEERKKREDETKESPPSSYLKSNNQNVEDYESFTSSYNCRNSFPNDPEFEAIVLEGELSIDSGNSPKLSSKGTSGCYFIFNRDKVTLILIFVFCPVLSTIDSCHYKFVSLYAH